MNHDFLPVTWREMRERGWDAPDFVYVTGDAYVDHPSFGLAIISRVLERAGYRVAMLPQPDWHTCEDFRRFGRPKIGFLVTAGVIDSMVNHYTAAKKPRSEDAYSPGGKAGRRPDRATIVYCNRIREAYADVPIAIGGVEASLRRFAHYDYWDDRVRNSILVDSGADVLMFGMGERAILRVAEWMRGEKPFSQMRIPGTCVMAGEIRRVFWRSSPLKPSQETERPMRARSPCSMPSRIRCAAGPSRRSIEALPFAKRPRPAAFAGGTRRRSRPPLRHTWHPMYADDGGVPAIDEVLLHRRGARLLRRMQLLRADIPPGPHCDLAQPRIHPRRGPAADRTARVQGYIHDVGGPTANFRHPACEKQRLIRRARTASAFPSP